MSKLEQLINELCPNGVEFKKIKNSYTRIKGTPITAKKMKEIASDDGEIKIFAGGKTVITAHEADIPNANITRVPAVLVQSRGVIDAIYYDKLFTFKNEMWAYTADNPIKVKYLYYILKNNIEHFREAASGMGSLPQISLRITEDFIIPIPPLPVQEEIVRILDKFTELTTELTAELTARKQQYEYYREQLFTFGDEVVWKSLKELLQPKGYIRGPFGSALKKDFFVNEGVPIYEQQHAIYNKREFRYYIDNNRAEKLKRFMVKPYDLIISCSGTIGKISIITPQDKEGIINQALLILRLDLTKVKIRYIKYYLECFTNLIVSSSGGAITNIEKKEIIEKIKIPVPPLEEQQHIVDILDRFDKLCNDISEGLPAEIEARQKQYEYYRDKLLTFKKKEAAENE